MFFDIFSALCQQSGVSRYKACTDIGLNRAAVAKWKNGAIPSGATLAKMADYFGVTTDYLLGIDPFAQKDLLLFKINNLEQELDSANESDKAEIEANIVVLKDSYEDLCLLTGCGIMPKKQIETAPTLTKKDERDIEKRLEAVLEDLENAQSGLAFSGEPLDEVTRELLAESLRNSMRIGKTLAKQKFTPKKYRKD